MGYSIRTSNYLKKITLSDLIHMINMDDIIAINVETPKTDIRCSLKKELAKLIHMNSWIILYLSIKLT